MKCHFMLEKQRFYEATPFYFKFDVIPEIFLGILRRNVRMSGKQGRIEVAKLCIEAELESTLTKSRLQLTP